MSVWVPKQYGAWAMLIAPVLTACIIAPGWPSLLVAVTWIVAYLAYMALRGIGRRHRHDALIASVVYGAGAGALAVGLLVWRPALMYWAVPLAVLLGVSLALIMAGRERSAINDMSLIGASALMAAVAGTAARLGPSLQLSGFLSDVAWPRAWLTAAALAGYFWGTIPYIKTMIRERGKIGWYIASVTYHVLLVVLSFGLNPWIGAFALVALARAALVPKIWPRAKPKCLGIGETIGTVVFIVILAVTLH